MFSNFDEIWYSCSVFGIEQEYVNVFFENFNIKPVKSVKTVIFLILSNPNEIHFSGSVFI